MVLRSAPAVLLLLLSAAPASAGFDEHRTFSSSELEVANVIGAVNVTGHAGADFEVFVRVQGKDGTRDQVRVEASPGGKATLTVVFPAAKRFVYPELGAGSRSTFSMRSADREWLHATFGGRGPEEITVAGSGSGLEVWADVEVRVPAGKRLVVRHGVGQLHATAVRGDLDLRTRSGAADARSIRGTLSIDTGSGHVEVGEIEGNLTIDTGSGHVTASDVRGDAIAIDTGSGHVDLARVQGKAINVDTGSGHVEADELAADEMKIDTGSGGIDVELDRMGGGAFRFDTGSGGIRLAIPREASASIEADTGSGGIDIALEGATVDRRDRDSARAKLGSGTAQIKLDTGSGGIRVRYAD
jgi:hypothetical protein